MRSVHKIFALFVLVFGVAGAANADVKIISIRSGDLVEASPLFKSGQAQIKSEFDKRKADLEAEARKLAEDVKKFQQEADIMSSDARAKSEKDLQTRKIDFDYKQRQFGEDFKKRDRELSEKLMSNIKEIVAQVAKEKGADLVVQDPVFAAPTVDVTNEVIQRLQSAKPAK